MGTSCFLGSLRERGSSCDLTFERLALEQGYRRVAGLDEVGRGALFGPVCAAAVVFDMAHTIPIGINDSKKLSANQRLQLAESIRRAAEDFSIAFVESSVIDRINILEATREAMRQAINGLKQKPDYILCDGIVITNLSIPQKNIIRGDTRSVSIAAASILAKVERDGLISRLDLDYPGYDLGNNKGYATSKHLQALNSLGPTPYHRVTFRGVRG
ncbi:MAG: ribonuclease HII [Acidobacteria bacterium]|nr:MAG: ribonuclease HII [Acidobacteriota bacterium]